jgi:hypothetical protein
MTAHELLAAARRAGIVLELREGLLVVGGPTAVLRAWLPRLRERRDALEVALIEEQDRRRPLWLQGRMCTRCRNTARAGNCLRPVEAGLAKRFELRWPPPGYAQRCPEFAPGGSSFEPPTPTGRGSKNEPPRR